MSTAEVWEIVFSGLSVVIGTLALLAVLTYLMGSVFKALENRSVASKQESSASASSSTPVAPLQNSQEEQLRLIAVLSAAASEVLGKSVRVVHFNPRNSGWNKD